MMFSNLLASSFFPQIWWSLWQNLYLFIFYMLTNRRSMFLSALLNIHLAFYVGYGKMDSSSPSGISAHGTHWNGDRSYPALTGMLITYLFWSYKDVSSNINKTEQNNVVLSWLSTSGNHIQELNGNSQFSSWYLFEFLLIFTCCSYI